MSADWKEKVYPHLPIFGQNVVCSVRGYTQKKLRYGGEFRELLSWLDDTQWWPKDKIEAYREEKLARLLRHAYETVPYYRRVWDAQNVRPSDIHSAADLHKLPILTKEDVRSHAKEMISTAANRAELVHSHTSGSTGKSLDFYLEPRAFQFRWALWWRHRRRFGVDVEASFATFTGLTAVPLTQQRPPFWRENWTMRQTIFTMHHITPAKIDAIVQRLNTGRFVYYAGYPSILYEVANLIRDKNLSFTNPPKIIFTGAETLHADQRALMSEVFGCPVTDQYGFSEGCGNASRCPEDRYHEDWEYGILECAAEHPQGHKCQQGSILATGFGSNAMPFIRYQVGDVGTWSDEPCPCGRHSTVLTAIEGRLEDYVVTPEGQRIRRFDYIFKDTHSVREAQVVQSEPGAICLRIVRRSNYAAADETFIRSEIQQRVSPTLRVEFEYVTEIPRESGGKFRAVKSFLPR